MAPFDSARLARLFEQASNLPSGSRDEFLQQECGADNALRDELRSLLSANDASADYFDRLAEQVVAPALHALADSADDELIPGMTVSHYRIVERIGRGGMGVVYAALDLSLGRSVALKFLPRHLTASAAAQARFLAEAKAASLLDHPNIGVIHEAAKTEDGRLFIAMTHYQGETLDRRIGRGAVPIQEAARVAAQIARALAAAHAKGVIHRDVKPSNILITSDGVAKLLDFGIAKMAGSELTRHGPTPGTIAYMSPEQTRGERLDHRTDLWSLGVVLCEMLTGVRPFHGEDDQVVVHAIRHDSWGRAGRSHPELPAALTRVVGRCLEKDASQRYRSAEELAADLETAGRPEAVNPSAPPARSRSPAGGLRRLQRYAALAALPGLILGAILYSGLSTEPPPADRVAAASPGNRLAVLPLESVSADPADAYLADGLTAELIARLSGLQGLRVIARSSLLPYKDTGRSAVDVARELRVGTHLEGSVQKSGERVRLTAQLVDTATGEHLWGGTYDSAMPDLMAVQLEIVRRVADVVQARADTDQPTEAVQTGSPAPGAYMAYLKGRYFLDKRDEESAWKARDHFRQALDLDPTYAQAWTGWSDTLEVLAWLSLMPASEAYAQSQAAAERALQLEPDLAEAHVSLARALFRHQFDFEAAATHLRRAIELNPSHADARQQYAAYLRIRGRFDEALNEARLAADLDPLSPSNLLEIGVTLYMARRYDEALDRYRRLLETRPDFTSAYFFVALVHVQRQQYELALATLDHATPAARWQDTETLRAYIYAVTDRQGEARARLDRLERLARTEPVSPWHAAVIHLGLGEYEQSLDRLELAFDHRSWQMPLLAVEPIFEPLHSNARFIALVERMRR